MLHAHHIVFANPAQPACCKAHPVNPIATPTTTTMAESAQVYFILFIQAAHPHAHSVLPPQLA